MNAVIAKLTRPRVAGIVERKRLLDHLTAINSNKIIWISAPAGSGKTTLAANWLDRRKLPCLWYQADEGDADIATFFSYLSAAVRHAAPRYRTPLPSLTPEYRLGIPTFTKRYFEALYGRLKKPFCLVIDNYQDVPAESAFHEVVSDGISVAPEGMSILIVSRFDPPPAFSRIRASGRLEVLDGVELGFTFEESRVLVASRGKKQLTDDVFKALYRKTEGWAAGLVLFAENILQEDGFHAFGQVPTEQIFDYFANVLYERVDDELRHFLLTTSLLPRMTIKAAEELTGNRRADQILSRLSRTNFFTVRHETPETVYQYHPLFREFLLLRARERFGREGMPHLAKKAALLLLRAGYVEDAARLLIEAEDWNGLTELVLQYAESYMAAGRFLTIGAWIYKIPVDIIERTGWLLYWKAMCRLATRPAEARAHMEKAYAIFQVKEDAAGSFLSWSGIVDTFMYEWKDFRPLDRWIDEFFRLQRRYGGFPAPGIEERATSSIFAALMFRQPQHPDLPQWTERVRDIMLSTADISHRMFIGYNLILYYLWTGRIDEAGSLVTMLSPVIKAEHGAPLPKLMWYRAEALYYFYVSRYEDGLKTVDQGLQRAAETGVHHLDLMFYGVGIYHSITSDRAARAQEFLGKMASSLNKGACYDLIYFAHQSSLVALITGCYEEAIAHAERCMQLTEIAGSPFILNGHQYTFANILFEAKHYDLVLPHLTEIRSRIPAFRCTHVDAWCSAMEAMLALTNGDAALFAEHARRAIDACKKTGFRYLITVRSTLARFCSKALELGIETEFIKELISLNKLRPDEASEISETWPWPIKIYTLGRFEVMLDDKPVVSPGRVQQKPLAMLKALIAFGGKDATEERLTDALWPDADGDVAHTSFDTTLHRLRKLVNNDKAIVLREGQVSLDERYCWVDVWAFEKIIAECGLRNAEGRTKTGIAESASAQSEAALLEKAINLYKGHFLPGDARQPWSISLRERLRAQFTRSVNTLGGIRVEAGRYDKAAMVFMKGLEIDDLAEELYQHLMACYHQMGQQTEAIKTYHRCRDVLQSSLGLKPSSKTEGVYYAIRQPG